MKPYPLSRISVFIFPFMSMPSFFRDLKSLHRHQKTVTLSIFCKKWCHQGRWTLSSCAQKLGTSIIDHNCHNTRFHDTLAELKLSDSFNRSIDQNDFSISISCSLLP
jgi:hypothetical protein